MALTRKRVAADLVLLDNFSAIVGGIEAGRLAFENLKKVSISFLHPIRVLMRSSSEYPLLASCW
jgi:hypothetical protein